LKARTASRKGLTPEMVNEPPPRATPVGNAESVGDTAKPPPGYGASHSFANAIRIALLRESGPNMWQRLLLLPEFLPMLRRKREMRKNIR